MKNAKIPTKAALVACFVIASAAVSQAQTLQTLIDVNISPAGGNGQAVLGGTSDTYNNVNGDSGANSTLFSNAVDSTNASTGLTISTGTGFKTFTDNGGTTSNPAFLMAGYSYNTPPYTGTQNTTITVSNLSGIGGGTTNYDGDTFTLVVYSAGDKSGQGGALTLSGASTAMGKTTGIDRDISNGVGDAYQLFTGTVSGDTLTITVAPNDSNPNDINGNTLFTIVNGFQLQITAVPEPGTWVSGAILMGTALLYFRRRISTAIRGSCA